MTTQEQAQWALALLWALLAVEAPIRWFVPVIGSWDTYAVKRLLALDEPTDRLVDAALTCAGYLVGHVQPAHQARRGDAVRAARHSISRRGATMTPDVADAIAILGRLRALARKRGQKGRPVLSRLRPGGSSLMKWIQSEPVRIASAKLGWYGYAVSSTRYEWIKSIDGALVDLKREADIAAEARR